NVDPWGIIIHGAEISGVLDLSSVVLRFPLALNRCRVTDAIHLISAELPFLDLSGSSVQTMRADRITVKGNVFLKDGFSSHGEVKVMGAQIEGSFVCERGILNNPAQKDVKESGTALMAESIRVNGNILLRKDFHAEGEVWLSGAEIGGTLDCSGGYFKNPEQE